MYHSFTASGPFPSSPGPLYQNEVKCSAFDMEMIFHSHANKTHFHKKGCALGLILKVRVFGTRKWPIYEYGMSSPDHFFDRYFSTIKRVGTTFEVTTYVEEQDIDFIF